MTLMLCFGMLLDGRAQATGIRQRGQDATILIVFNAYHDVVQFTLPGGDDNAHWLLMIDTNQADAETTRADFQPAMSMRLPGAHC